VHGRYASACRSRQLRVHQLGARPTRLRHSRGPRLSQGQRCALRLSKQLSTAEVSFLRRSSRIGDDRLARGRCHWGKTPLSSGEDQACNYQDAERQQSCKTPHFIDYNECAAESLRPSDRYVPSGVGRSIKEYRASALWSNRSRSTTSETRAVLSTSRLHRSHRRSLWRAGHPASTSRL
jgi:hypothetical protein